MGICFGKCLLPKNTKKIPRKQKSAVENELKEIRNLDLTINIEEETQNDVVIEKNFPQFEEYEVELSVTSRNSKQFDGDETSPTVTSFAVLRGNANKDGKPNAKG